MAKIVMYGAEFTDRLVAQAQRFGVEILKAQSVTGLSREAESRYVRTGADAALQVAGMSVFVGQRPNTRWLPPGIQKDETGFIITKPNLETSVPGVFATGDARKGSTKQAASAADEGATAAIRIRDYLRSR